jgi:hypothetical protein
MPSLEPSSTVQSNQGRYCLDLTPEEFRLIVRLVRELNQLLDSHGLVDSLSKKFQALDSEA